MSVHRFGQVYFSHLRKQQQWSVSMTKCVCTVVKYNVLLWYWACSNMCSAMWCQSKSASSTPHHVVGTWTHTYPDILNVQVMVLLCTEDPLHHVRCSDVWEVIRPVLAMTHPTRKGPGQTCMETWTTHREGWKCSVCHQCTVSTSNECLHISHLWHTRLSGEKKQYKKLW